MKKLIGYWANFGVKEHYQLWEVFLTRKVNTMSLLAFFNVTISYLIFPLLGLNEFQGLLLFSMFMAPAVALLNSMVHYKIGVYGFFVFGAIILGFLSSRLGPDSLFFIFYFPIFLSVVQLLGRKELLIHMTIILFIYIATIIWVVFQFSEPSMQIVIDEKSLSRVKIFNILLASLSAVSFVLIITFESVKHEQLLKSALKEKDTLMAEVFHRVKNNMNIVTSLLNLKKDNTNNEEVREAIEDCRSRVYSMALVHQKIFQQKSISGLAFLDYVKELVSDISGSMGEPEDNEVKVYGIDMELPLNFAIPCGLIINELITNSYKHARIPGHRLNILIELSLENNKRKIKYMDNGPGLTQNAESKNSLGLDLIKSLCEQIDGECKFSNREGLLFTLLF